MEEIFFAAFFTVVFLGGSSNCEVLKMSNCDREYVYCYREDLFAFCVDAEELQIFWKFDVRCLLGAECVQDNFPCATSTSSDSRFEYIVKANITDTNNTNSSTEATETATATASTLNFTSTEVSKITNSTTNGTTTPILTTPTTTETSTETATTTTIPGTITTIGPPPCTNVNTSKGPNCQQYYECIAVWWWYEPRLRTCPSGESYNATKSGCIADATCIIQA